MSHGQNLKIYAVNRMVNFSKGKRNGLKTEICFEILHLNEPYLDDLAWLGKALDKETHLYLRKENTLQIPKITLKS